MAESGLDSLRKSRAVTVEWKAFELRPGGRFPGAPEQEARYREYIREKHGHMWAYAREHFGLEMKEGPWLVNSRPALEGAVYARKHGRHEDYHHACFAAHWQAGRRLDEMETLVEIARSAGLDGDEFRQAVESRRHRAEVEMDLMLAREYGINSIPAFVFAGRYLVSGAQPARVLEQVVDQCIAEGLSD